MNQLLKSFHGNVSQRETLKAFMVQVLKDIAVEKTFAGEPVTGIKEASELITRMFDKLDEEYAVDPEPDIPNSQ